MPPGEAVDGVRRLHGGGDGAPVGSALRDGAPAGRAAINVDDALLVLCNRAFRLAEEQASVSVEIAHLVLCLTAVPLPDADFRHVGLERRRLSDAARSRLHGVQRGHDGSQPRTSGELKVLLSRAEAIAVRAGRKFAAPGDLISALAGHSADLSSARFTEEAVDQRAGAGAISGASEPMASQHRASSRPGFGPRPSQLQFRFDGRYRPGTEGRSFEGAHYGGVDGGRHYPGAQHFDRPRGDGALSDSPGQTLRDERREAPRPEPHRHAPRRADDVRHDESREKASEADEAAVTSRGAAPAEAGGDGLAERLRRQEMLVTDLVGLVSRVIDTRVGTATARASSGKRRQRETVEGDTAEGVAVAAPAVTTGGTAASAALVSSSGSSGGNVTRSRGPASRATSDGGSRASASSGAGGLLRFKRRRRLVFGSMGRTSTTVRGDGEGSRRASEGVLRVVSRNEPESGGRRLRAVADPAGEFDDANGLGQDFEIEDELDGQGDGPGDRMKRFYLSPGDDIVKAPSIGPKTAARLTPAGLVLVRDLLACDPEEIVARTANRYITAARIADWKAQARLVCTIPWLRGTHAQLLVGAGYDTLSKLSRADASSVCSAILRFAATREGQSILRSGPPPEIDRIACWIENTALAEPARAA